MLHWLAVLEWQGPVYKLILYSNKPVFFRARLYPVQLMPTLPAAVKESCSAQTKRMSGFQTFNAEFIRKRAEGYNELQVPSMEGLPVWFTSHN